MKYIKLYEDKQIPMTFLKWVNSVSHAVNKNISELRFSYIPVTNLIGVGLFKNIKLINFENTLVESLEGIEECIELKEMYFADAKVKSLKGIEKLSNLTVLYCAYNQITSFNEIGLLPNLSEISIVGNPLELPIPARIVERFPYIYGTKTNFKTLDFQKWFLREYPERYPDLIPIGLHPNLEKEWQEVKGFIGR